MTSVNRVSQPPRRANYKPLTCTDSVSEGGSTPYPHIAL